jgi:hypothetical protein
MKTAVGFGGATGPHRATVRVLEGIRFTEADVRWWCRLTEATADLARRCSAGLTFTADRISEALALLSNTFAWRLTDDFVAFTAMRWHRNTLGAAQWLDHVPTHESRRAPSPEQSDHF